MLFAAAVAALVAAAGEEPAKFLQKSFFVSTEKFPSKISVRSEFFGRFGFKPRPMQLEN